MCLQGRHCHRIVADVALGLQSPLANVVLATLVQSRLMAVPPSEWQLVLRLEEVIAVQTGWGSSANSFIWRKKPLWFSIHLMNKMYTHYSQKRTFTIQSSCSIQKAVPWLQSKTLKNNQPNKKPKPPKTPQIIPWPGFPCNLTFTLRLLLSLFTSWAKPTNFT